MEYFFIPIAYAGVITDATPLSSVLVNVLQWLLGIFGVVALIAFVGSGLLYLLAQGNDKVVERAKRWTGYAFVGVLVAIGSLVLLSSLSSLL